MQARAMGAAILDIMDDLEAAVGKLVPYHVGSVTIQPFPDIDPEYYRDLCTGVSLKNQKIINPKLFQFLQPDLCWNSLNFKYGL